ncbi:MAG TPA: DUF4337 family protein [Verrucomicrobiae bacterium]|nr:DUF4337 family protein [Verrucomicrobiae bacterium]
MKVVIPNELKAEMPPTMFGRILSATPVVMAVVATMLAGLASSEMTRAQYDRSLAAQQQSKAGDQWSFFQAKRMRGAFQLNTAELLQAVSAVRPFEPTALTQWSEGKPELAAVISSPDGQRALGFLQRSEVPSNSTVVAWDPKIQAALDGLEALRPDSDMAALLAPVDVKSLEDALRAARDQVDALDTATKPINEAIDRMDALVSHQAALSAGTGGGSSLSVHRDFTVARLRYTAVRYEVEARLNQAIANLYELQVRKSNFSAERHHARSQKFFFGMLGAQLGVIVSTFAMAARNRNLLWSLAAAAGLLAIGFAVYVYLCV